MKRLLFICAFACIALAISGADTSDRWVSVKTAVLKSSTGWFASKIASVSYGDKVSLVGNKGTWAQVRLSSGKTGWISKANLTTKKIVASGLSSVSANAHEISLAGKGFSAEIEDEYKKTSEIDYDAVDDVEKIAVSDADVVKFIADGGLKGAEQ